MGPVSLAFGAATTVILGLSLWSRDRTAPWLGLMLLAGWGLWQALPAIFPIPQAWLPFPIFDLGCFTVCVMLASGLGMRWIWLLSLAFMGQLIAHGAFWLNYAQLGERPDKYAAWRLEWTYALILNVLFACQLACVAWPGVRHALELASRSGIPALHLRRGRPF